MYPKIKPSVRIVRLPDRVFVYEHYRGTRKNCHPIVGFVLALCTGQVSVKVIAGCVSRSWHFPEEEAGELVNGLLDGEMKDCITMEDEPSDEPDGRYDFRDFFYKPGELSVRTAYPLDVQLVLTNLCNFRCRYCFNSSSPSGDYGMPTENWTELINQLGNLGVIKIDLTGGEPFARGDIEDIIRAAVRNNMLITIFTNGSLITPEIAGRLAKVPGLIVQVSLDSPDPDTHHLVTDSHGSFDKVINAIRCLTKAGVFTRVKALMTPVTFEGAGRLVEMCYGMGVKSLTLDVFDLAFVGRGNREFFLDAEQMKIIQGAVDLANEKYGETMPVRFTAGRKTWKDETEIVSCGALTTGMTVLADGTCTLCEKTAGDPACVIGRFPELTAEQIWNSPRINEIMNPPARDFEEPCRSCEFIEKCAGGCPAMRRLVNREGRCADPRCWKADYPDNPFR